MWLNESLETLREPVRARCREIILDAVARFGNELLSVVGIISDRNVDRELDKLFQMHLTDSIGGRKVDFVKTHKSQLEDSFVTMIQSRVQAGINQAMETIPFPTSSLRYHKDSSAVMKYYRQQGHGNRRAYKSTKRGKRRS